MARALTSDETGLFVLEEMVATLDDARFDPRDEASLAEQAPHLKRLANNPRFLADVAIAGRAEIAH